MLLKIKIHIIIHKNIHKIKNSLKNFLISVKNNWQTYVHVYMESNNLYEASRIIQTNRIHLYLVYQCLNCGMCHYSNYEIKNHLIDKHNASRKWLEGLNQMPYSEISACKEDGSFYKVVNGKKIWLCSENMELL
jgi:hypothetical protein